MRFYPNPPLLEHMASDDLADIADSLAERLASDPSEGAEFVMDALDACLVGLADRRPVGEYAPETGFEYHLTRARHELMMAIRGAHHREHSPGRAQMQKRPSVPIRARNRQR